MLRPSCFALCLSETSFDRGVCQNEIFALSVFSERIRIARVIIMVLADFQSCEGVRAFLARTRIVSAALPLQFDVRVLQKELHHFGLPPRARMSEGSIPFKSR